MISTAVAVAAAVEAQFMSTVQRGRPRAPSLRGAGPENVSPRAAEGRGRSSLSLLPCRHSVMRLCDVRPSFQNPLSFFDSCFFLGGFDFVPTCLLLLLVVQLHPWLCLHMCVCGCVLWLCTHSFLPPPPHSCLARLPASKSTVSSHRRCVSVCACAVKKYAEPLSMRCPGSPILDH